MELNIKKGNFLLRALQVFLKHSLTLFIYYFSAFVLSPDSFGEAVYYISIASFVLVFCDFGISASITKYISGKEFTESKYKEGQILSKVVFQLGVYSLIVISIFVIIFNLIEIGSLSVNKSALYLLLPYIFFTPVISVFDGYLVGKSSFKLLLKINALHWVFSMLITFILVKHLLFEGVMISLSVNSFILFVLFVFFHITELSPKIKSVKIDGIFSYSIVIGLSSMGYFLYTRFDVFVLKYFGYTQEIGFYEIINRLFAILVIPFAIFGQVQAPIVSSYRTSSSAKSIYSYFKKTLGVVFLIGVILSISLYITFPLLIEVFMSDLDKEKFVLINNVLVCVLPLKFVGVVSTIGFITPLGKAKITTFVTLIFGIVNVFLDIYFIQILGFLGIFLATFFVQNFAIVIQLLIFKKYLNGQNVSNSL